MSDTLPQPDGSTDVPLNEVRPLGQPPAEALRPHAGHNPSSAMEDIDREVADAMAAMDTADIAELCGGVNAGAMPQERIESESLAPGTELVGTVCGVSDDDVFLDFGAKSQGVLPRSQFGKKEAVDVGRRVDVVVERLDSAAGLLIVNRKGAIQRATWTNLTLGGIVEGKVSGVIKGGLELDLKGIRAFMPASQVDTAPMKDISLLLNQIVRCEVVELDRRNKNVVLSRRKVMEREQAAARENLKAELEVGQVRRGIVGNITDFGAFVDLGGVDGLLHIRDLSWGTVEKVSDVLSPGQEVEVKILRINSQRDRISLGLKQVMPDPWVNVPQRYPVGTTLKARIIRLADFGAFAELEPGVEGLVPLSEMSWTRVNRASDAVSVGAIVDVAVIRAEPDKHRLALSMKQAQPDPWATVLESFTAQSLAKGRVTRLADFGAFVELVPGVEGLIHISELTDRRVKSCGEVVQVGQEVEARVLGVDRENRRISLSLKQAVAPQVPEPAPGGDKKPAKAQKKRKRPLRGGLASHFDW